MHCLRLFTFVIILTLYPLSHAASNVLILFYMFWICIWNIQWRWSIYICILCGVLSCDSSPICKKYWLCRCIPLTLLMIIQNPQWTMRLLYSLRFFLPSFNIVGQLLRVCSRVSWCEHNSYLELDLFPHLMRLLFVGRVSRTELINNSW